ncbi:MAG: D-glycero-beta-D-manno-heptose 1,7-bisphosphate 7-phosphatase [Desulfobacterales bacterium]|nr:D-glycero-beta-D-manno-heptose 1,7-bisphosphate 7-phosphatase [Desulfobacterales bacterium]
MMRVVFLDRDGVINRDSPDYIKGWHEFVFLSGSLDAIARLTRAGLPVIVVTNQSAIFRGLITQEILADMHRRMLRAVADAGGRIFDIRHCPHGPDQACGCRKPAPGMLLSAAADHGIDLAASAMVGDSAKDILCARNAGCGCSILVETGDFASARTKLAHKGIDPDHVAPDLNGAVDWIIHHCGPGENPLP